MKAGCACVLLMRMDARPPCPLQIVQEFILRFMLDQFNHLRIVAGMIQCIGCIGNERLPLPGMIACPAFPDETEYEK